MEIGKFEENGRNIGKIRKLSLHSGKVCFYLGISGNVLVFSNFCETFSFFYSKLMLG